ncbi:FecR family protein [Parapedobacter indicus]|uniref:FecR family protein n=1 Tax=Parapedobacter indicus TaxID=1477437 RepID=A0A1I3PMN0_9SPHI|nr:FecR domain-containing protein [Parapedobacter indicus]PPL00508.1 FecR family protein [Parapedobacter indicus]SFJ22753.1 FecR family protein [Parapedobacter indicus]
MPDQEKISQLFADRIAGSLSEEDNSLLEWLLSTDEGIRTKWREYSKTFEDASSQRFLGELDADRAWLSVSQRIAEKRTTAPRQKNSWMLAAVASVLIVITCLGFWNYFSSTPIAANLEEVAVGSDVVLELWSGERYHLLDTTQGTTLIRKASAGFRALSVEKHQPELQPEAFNTISVPATRDYYLVLPDGSEVWLNSSSVLRIPASFQTFSREVFLTGEAYFKVANQAKLPFTVHADNVDIQVLGTEFNVNTFDRAQIITSLFSGAIEARVNDHRMRLSPGFEAVATAEGLLSRTFDPTTTATWRAGIYHFENEPLKRLLPVLERWYGKRIRTTDPALAAMKLSGAIHKSDSITVFLENLKATANIRYQFSGGKLLLSGTTPE